MMAKIERFKVVMLIGDLGVGGTEHQLFQMLCHIDHQQVECHVIVFRAAGNQEYTTALEALGIHIWTIPAQQRSILQRLRFVYRTLREIRPAVVHSWSDYLNPYTGLAGRLAGVPMRLGSLRGSLHSEGKAQIPRIYKMLMIRAVDKIVVNANGLAKELLAQKYPSERIIIVPNCIDATLYHNESSAPIADLSDYGIGATARVVGIIGNIRRVKNLPFFVQGMIPIVQQNPDVYGIIVGQEAPGYPGLRAELETLIQDAGVEKRILLLGYRDDVPALLRRMAIVCLTSLTEGMPNTIMEAMATARPVVATAVGGVLELVQDGVNGLLIQPGDNAGFSQAIQHLLDHPEIGQEMGRRGQMMIQQHRSCQHTAARLMRLYMNNAD